MLDFRIYIYKKKTPLYGLAQKDQTKGREKFYGHHNIR